MVELTPRVYISRNMIRISKVGELYTANVKPIGSPSLEPKWESPQPMGAKELFESLMKIGCNPIDIWDAFYVADPSLKQL